MSTKLRCDEVSRSCNIIPLQTGAFAFPGDLFALKASPNTGKNVSKTNPAPTFPYDFD